MKRSLILVLLVLTSLYIAPQRADACSLGGPVSITSDLHVFTYDGEKVIDEDLEDYELDGACDFSGRLQYGTANSFILEDPRDTYKIYEVDSEELSSTDFSVPPATSSSGLSRISFSSEMAIYGSGSIHGFDLSNSTQSLPYETYNLATGEFASASMDLTPLLQQQQNLGNGSSTSLRVMDLKVAGHHVALSLHQSFYFPANNSEIEFIYYYSSLADLPIIREINSFSIEYSLKLVDPKQPQVLLSNLADQLYLLDFSAQELINLDVTQPIDYGYSQFSGDMIYISDYQSNILLNLTSQEKTYMELEVDEFLLLDDYIVGGSTSTASSIPMPFITGLGILVAIPVVIFLKKKL